MSCTCHSLLFVHRLTRLLPFVLLLLWLAVPGSSPAQQTFGFTYDFNREANEAAAEDGWRTTLHDLYTGGYQWSRDLGNGAFLQVDFQMTMDYRGKLTGQGALYYTEPGLEYYAPCTLNGWLRGPLGRPHALGNRLFLVFRAKGASTYDDGSSVYEGLPSSALLTMRLAGDYEGLPHDPINYVEGFTNFRLNIRGLGRLTYKNIATDFDLPVPTYDPGTWLLETEYTMNGLSLSGTAWIYLANDRVLTFQLTGFYDDFYDEYVYFLRGSNFSSRGNQLRLVEEREADGRFTLAFMSGRILRNIILY